MNLKKLIFISVIIFSLISCGGVVKKNIYSQELGLNESYENAKKDFIESATAENVLESENVLENLTQIESLNFKFTPNLQNYEQLKNYFIQIRDARFLYQFNMPNFPRRISWLYPQDGCFARATAISTYAERIGLIKPTKIFAFGDLKVYTTYSINGFVKWWYHVAPVLGVNGQYYVLDPSMDFNNPIPVENWYKLMKLSESSEIFGAVCKEYTDVPSDSCFNSQNDNGNEMLNLLQDTYLLDEKNNLLDLNYDWYKLLGDNPPWISK